MALHRCGGRIRCGFPWLVDADIRSFFNEIPHRPPLSVFDGLVRDRGLRSIIRQWLENFASTRSLFGGDRGIPQGAVVSPFLCNLYLDGLDRAWAGQRIPFVRYADDFLLFTPTEAEARRALEFTTQRLDFLGLALHPEKSRVVRATRDVAFLDPRLPAPPGRRGYVRMPMRTVDASLRKRLICKLLLL